MINNFDFEHGDLLSKRAKEITGPILDIKNLFNKHGLPVIYINDHYNLWQADFEKIMDYCRNEKSEQIIDKLAPTEKDYFLIKPKHSAFYGTALDTLLQQLKVDTVVITGVAGNICVLFTANDAYMREYQLIVPENCIASNHEQDNQYTLKMMRDTLKANTKPSSEQKFI
ncbi:isochorismatase [Bacillus sp. T33-2]|nr:isochorismatase [Bacillus sp. T33-2]